MAAPRAAAAVVAGATEEGLTVRRWVVAVATEEEKVARAARMEVRRAAPEVRQVPPVPGMSTL